MNKLVCLLSFLIITSSSFAQGIEFFQGEWKEALAMAKSEDKLVFVDAFAKWCGPCKKMAKTVFTDASVGDFYNEQFINLKMDMEEGQGLEFGAKYPVKAYPTLLFLDGDGNIVLKKTGAKQVEAFIDLGKEAIMKFDRSADFAVQYEEGERDFTFMLKYIKELNKVGKSSLKIANDYLRSNPVISAEEKALFVMEAATEADSRLFELFIEHKDLAENQSSKELVNSKIKLACENTVKKAIEFESEFLMEEAKNKMKKHYKEGYESFTIESDMKYAVAFGLEEDYIDASKKYAKKIISKDAESLNRLAMKMENSFSKSERVLEEAVKICEKSIKLEKENIDFRLNLAKIQLSAKKNQEALQTAKETLEIATKMGQNTRQINGLIKYIESIIDKT